MVQGWREGAPPLEPVGGGADFYPGHEEWISLDLPPGRYLIVCGITQAQRTNGTPHYDIGMTWEFESR